jgi:large subunit ribosomal protein L4
VKQLARKCALSAKATAKQIKVMEDLSIATPKTKEFVSILENISLTVEKTLFVVSQSNENVYMSARNIPNARVVTVDEITTYDLVHTDYLVLFESAVEVLQNRLN